MSPSLFHTLQLSRQDMLNQIHELGTVSDNLANVNTTGFKRSRTNFQELLAGQLVEGSRPVASQVLMQQGTLQSSQSPLDWAIQGEGFFPLRLPDGQVGFTRDGHFTRDASGQLVSPSGFPLDWQGQIPDDAVNLSVLAGGQVQVIRAGGEVEVAGTVQLARFANPGGLYSFGQNVWKETPASGAPQVGQPGVGQTGQVLTRTVEGSNTDLSREMTSLVALQRAFQMSVRAFQQTDNMIGQAIHMRKA